LGAFACLGWGSLIWEPGDLPISHEWREDGPKLPLEFARKSKDGRMTLVVCKQGTLCPTLWNTLSSPSLDEARAALARREDLPSIKNAAFWTGSGSSGHHGAEFVGAWAMDLASRVLYGLVFLQNHQSRIRTTIIRQLRMSSRTLAVSGEILHVEPKSTFVEHQTRLRLHTELALSKSSVGTDLAIGDFQAKVSSEEAEGRIGWQDQYPQRRVHPKSPDVWVDFLPQCSSA